MTGANDQIVEHAAQCDTVCKSIKAPEYELYAASWHIGPSVVQCYC